MLPQMMSFQQYYSPLTTSLEQHYSHVDNNDFCNNDDAINNIKAYNICVELYNSTRGTHFNSPVDDKGVNYSNISINDEDKRRYDTPINNRDN